MATIDKKEVSKWSSAKGKHFETGWYDIITYDGVQLNEVYAENGYFHVILGERRSIPNEKVEWARIHT